MKSFHVAVAFVDFCNPRACSGVNPGETAMEYLKGPSCTASSSHTNTSVTTMSSASDRELSQNYNRNSDNHYDTTKLVLFMTTDGMKDREITHHQHTNADFGSPSLRDDIRRRAMLLSQGSFDVEYWRNELRQTSQRWTSGGEVMKRNCVVM